MSISRFGPDDSTRIWDHLNQIAAETEDAIQGVAPAWQPFVPSWTDGSNSLQVGTGGSITGRWMTSGRLVAFQIILQRGAGANVGSGSWVFGLPVAARSYQWVQGAGTLTGNGKMLPLTVLGVGAKGVGLLVPAGRVSTTLPGSWGEETIAFGGTYER